MAVAAAQKPMNEDSKAAKDQYVAPNELVHMLTASRENHRLTWNLHLLRY
jgi:hypothetical protein